MEEEEITFEDINTSSNLPDRQAPHHFCYCQSCCQCRPFMNELAALSLAKEERLNRKQQLLTHCKRIEALLL